MQREVVELNSGIGISSVGELLSAHSELSQVAADTVKLANMLRQAGQYDEALELYETALALYQKRHGPDMVRNAATCRSNMDNLYGDLLQYDKAREQYQLAAGIRQQLGEHDTLEFAADAAGIGNCHFFMQEYDEAIHQHRVALGIRERAYGSDHEHVGHSLNNLGMSLQKQGRLDEAIEYYERALAIKVKLSGPDCESVARTYNNIGMLYEQHPSQLVEQALRCYRKSINIKIRIFGLEHMVSAGVHGVELLLPNLPAK